MRGPGKSAAVGALVAAVAFGCTSGDVARPGSPDEIGRPSSAPRVRRLSTREYANSVRDLLGEEIDPRQFPPDLLTLGYDNGPAGLDVGVEQAAAYERVSEAVASSAVRKGWQRLAGDCDPSRHSVAQCRDRLITVFGRRAFRRPLRDAEVGRLRQVFDTVFSNDDAAGAAQATLEAILQSPAFLYRSELGAAPDLGRAPLDPWERATALSYFLAGSTPDEPLMRAAEQGSLATRAGVRAEALRLLDGPPGRTQLREFVEQWLGLGRLANTTKDPRVFPEFDKDLRASMQEELARFLEDALDGGRGTLRDLLTTNVTFVDARLARIYGVSYQGEGFQRVELDRELRGGVLTRSGYLTVHSATDGTSPVERGLFTRSAFLCAAVPAPPPGIDRNVPKTTAPTARERFAQHDANPRCQFCHAAIDGVGFGFEAFDPLGRWKPFEGSAPVATTGVLLDADEADGTFEGVVGLEARLLESPRFVDCFVRHAFRFAMGSPETSSDEVSLRVLRRGFNVNTPLAALFTAIAASPAFLERWPQ